MYDAINLISTGSTLNSTVKYWVSGVDVGCSANYMWCGINQPFNQNEQVWLTGEPTSKGKSSGCMSINLNTPSYGVAIEPCDSILGYICE
jgi:hypothetical protein